MGPENREVKACEWESVHAEENLQHSGEKGTLREKSELN